MIQVLPEEMTIPVLPDHFSFQNLFSQVSNRPILSLRCQHRISLSLYQSLSTLNRASYHSRQSSPIVRAEVPPTSWSEQEAYREAFEAVDHLLAEQARLSIPIFSDKTPESQKKASSLAHLSYIFASCSHSSFSGNQNGPTCRKLESINVYTSRAFEPSHSTDSPRIPWADRLRGPKNLFLPAPSSSLSTLSNQQLLHQAARVLHATSSGPGLKPEARVPPKLSGSEACALPAEARVPPKLSGPALSSSPPLDMVPHSRAPPTLESLSTGTLLSYAHRLAGLPSKDRSL